MQCDVARCGRKAMVEVMFHHGGDFAYCEWHAYRYGKLRWASTHVRGIRRLDIATPKPLR